MINNKMFQMKHLFYYNIVKITQGNQCVGNTYTHTFRVDSTFNALYMSPVKPQKLGNELQSSNTSEDYDPLESYKNMKLDEVVGKEDNKKTYSTLAYIGMGVTLLLVGFVIFQLLRYRKKLSEK